MDFGSPLDSRGVSPTRPSGPRRGWTSPRTPDAGPRSVTHAAPRAQACVDFGYLPPSVAPSTPLPSLTPTNHPQPHHPLVALGDHRHSPNNTRTCPHPPPPMLPLFVFSICISSPHSNVHHGLGYPFSLVNVWFIAYNKNPDNDKAGGRPNRLPELCQHSPPASLLPLPSPLSHPRTIPNPITLLSHSATTVTHQTIHARARTPPPPCCLCLYFPFVFLHLTQTSIMA